MSAGPGLFTVASASDFITLFLLLSTVLTMGEKRKRSSTANARAAASAASKRQSNTPALQPTPETSEPEVPITFARDRPLPVFPKPQVDDLSLREYKSVAERYADPRSVY
jgi:hypothetical protein